MKHTPNPQLLKGSLVEKSGRFGVIFDGDTLSPIRLVNWGGSVSSAWADTLSSAANLRQQLIERKMPR